MDTYQPKHKTARRLLAGIVTAGVIYTIASLGDYANVNDINRQYLYPRGKAGIEENIGKRVTELNQYAQTNPIQAARYKDNLVQTGLSLEGALSEQSYALVIPEAEKKLTQDPLTYKQPILAVTNALMAVGDYETLKTIADNIPAKTKLRIFTDNCLESIKEGYQTAADWLTGKSAVSTDSTKQEKPAGS